jgi:hypothetical protein
LIVLAVRQALLPLLRAVFLYIFTTNSMDLTVILKLRS